MPGEVGILGLLGGIIQVAQEVPLGLGTHLLDELAQHESRDVPHIVVRPLRKGSAQPKLLTS